MAILIDQILKQARERYLFALAPHAQAGDEEALFGELDRLRASISESARLGAVNSDPLELSDLQSQLHGALDDSLKASITKLIESRARDLAQWAQRDGVTGLLNRAAFERRLTDEVERARRYRRPLSLILFDIDHFKSINDRFGHPAGDLALRQVAQTLQSALRRTDAVFRYGGDEFIALCPETACDAATALIHRIETSFGQSGLETDATKPISLSWGIASFPLDAQEIEDLIIEADRRLYVCKKNHHQSITASAR